MRADMWLPGARRRWVVVCQTRRRHVAVGIDPEDVTDVILENVALRPRNLADAIRAYCSADRASRSPRSEDRKIGGSR